MADRLGLGRHLPAAQRCRTSRATPTVATFRWHVEQAKWMGPERIDELRQVPARRPLGPRSRASGSRATSCCSPRRGSQGRRGLPPARPAEAAGESVVLGLDWGRAASWHARRHRRLSGRLPRQPQSPSSTCHGWRRAAAPLSEVEHRGQPGWRSQPSRPRPYLTAPHLRASTPGRAERPPVPPGRPDPARTHAAYKPPATTSRAVWSEEVATGSAPAPSGPWPSGCRTSTSSGAHLGSGSKEDAFEPCPDGLREGALVLRTTALLAQAPSGSRRPRRPARRSRSRPGVGSVHDNLADAFALEVAHHRRTRADRGRAAGLGTAHMAPHALRSQYPLTPAARDSTRTRVVDPW